MNWSYYAVLISYPPSEDGVGVGAVTDHQSLGAGKRMYGRKPFGCLGGP